MEKEQRKKLLQDLKSTQFGQALESYLEEKVNGLNSISNLKEDADFEVNARANKKAVSIVQDLFSIMTSQEFVKKEKRTYD